MAIQQKYAMYLCKLAIHYRGCKDKIEETIPRNLKVTGH
jgi:hypothetical protein